MTEELTQGEILHGVITDHFRARYDTRYIEELQQRWDDEFEVQGHPLIVIFGLHDVQPGEGMVALVNKRTYVALGMRD